jgi:hypothetical protein
MNAFIEVALRSLEWLTGRPETVLVLLAALPLLPLIVRVTFMSLVAIAIVAGGVTLIFFRADELMLAVLAIGASALLVSIDGSLVRRRLMNVEQSLASTAKAIRTLEIAEERRQVFVARQLIPPRQIDKKTSPVLAKSESQSSDPQQGQASAEPNSSPVNNPSFRSQSAAADRRPSTGTGSAEASAR